MINIASPVTAPTRPVLRYHGGKWMLAPWIISHFPAHSVYVEPFGGAASVLLRKPRSYAEIYNDLDSDVVGLFRVLRDAEQAERLREMLALTPFARDEFVLAYQPSDCPIEAARRMIIRSFMGFGSDGTNVDKPTGFRANSNRSGTTPAHDWGNFPAALAIAIDRLTGVTIENRHAKETMAQHDGVATLHYVDPPYTHDTRAKGMGANYCHELTDADHAELLAFLTGLKGFVILSGYRSTLYDEALPGWTRIDRAAFADGARKRVESLWLNPAAAAARPLGDLFEALEESV